MTTLQWATKQLPCGMIVEDSRGYYSAPASDRGIEVFHSVCGDQLAVNVGDLTYLSNYDLKIFGPHLVKLAFLQKATLDLRFENHFVDSVFDERCLLIAQPEGMVKRQFNNIGGRNRVVSLIFSAELLSESLSIPASILPVALRKFENDRVDDFHLANYAMCPEMRTCVAKILDADLRDPLSGLLVESKSLELLYLFFNALRDRHSKYRAPCRLLQRDRSRLEDIKHLLEENFFLTPPSLEELGRLAGMSRSKLAAGFKQEFGLTVGEFCLQQRMHRAREMLHGGSALISEIAYAVGYEHQSSFSHAYKAYFGTLPKSDRKHSYQ